MTPPRPDLRGTAASSSSAAADERRNARLYLSSLAVSLVGDSAMVLVAGIWVKSLTGSSALAGLVSVCIYAPSLAGPAAGLVADRAPRQRLVWWVNVTSAVIVLSLVAVHGRGQVWLIYAVMAAYGLSLVLMGPAEDALFVEMFSQEVRQRMNGSRLALQEAGRLVAPLVGAGLFALVGGQAVAGLDAATFVVAAVLVSRLRVDAPPPVGARGHWWHDITAGARHIRRTPTLRSMVVAAAGVMAVSGVGVAAQYSLVTAVGEPPGFLGVFAAALGAGSIIASVTSARVVARLGEPALAVLGLVDYTVAATLYASGRLAAAVLGAFVFGFALPWVFLATLNATQRLTPDALQGRVSAAVTLMLFGPQAPMQALGSYAISVGSYRQVYSASAAAAAGLAAWLWSATRRRSETRRRLASRL